MRTAIVIPARYASTRLPGKPLIKIAGITMLQRVYEMALDATKNFSDIEVLIATDDERIVKHAKEINAKVRADVGAFARLDGVIFLNMLPKTRSGKILRGTIRKICNKQEYNFPSTIDDASALDLIKTSFDAW